MVKPSFQLAPDMVASQSLINLADHHKNVLGMEPKIFEMDPVFAKFYTLSNNAC